MHLPEDDFRINYFICIVDQSISSFESKFEQFKRYEDIFGFLHDLKKLKSLDDNCLKTSCLNLESFLKQDTSFDLNGLDLFSELMILKEVFHNETKRPL